MAAKNALTVKSVDGLLKSMLVLSRAVDHILENRAVEAAVGRPLSSSKVQIIRLLGQRGGQTSTQVARFLGVSKPAVSQIIDTMVREKFVVRRTAQHDRRELNLQLSARGRQLFQAIRDEQRYFVRNALRQHTSPAPEKWVAVMQEISASLVQADHAYQHYCLQCGAHEDGSCVLVGGEAECSFLKHTGRRRSSEPRVAAR